MLWTDCLLVHEGTARPQGEQVGASCMRPSSRPSRAGVTVTGSLTGLTRPRNCISLATIEAKPPHFSVKRAWARQPVPVPSSHRWLVKTLLRKHQENQMSCRTHSGLVCRRTL